MGAPESDATVLFERIAGQLRQFGNWELILYLRRTCTGAATADPRYCELLYMYGLGNTGKDVIGLLFMTFVGFSDIRYAVVAPGGFMVQGASRRWRRTRSAGGKAARARCQSTKISTASSLSRSGSNRERQCWAKASTASVRLPPCCRHDDHIQSSAMPVQLDSGCLGVEESATMADHHRVCRLPQLLTQKKCDDQVKGKIALGMCSGQLLWLAIGLAGTLQPNLNPVSQTDRSHLARRSSSGSSLGVRGGPERGEL